MRKFRVSVGANQYEVAIEEILEGQTTAPATAQAPARPAPAAAPTSSRPAPAPAAPTGQNTVVAAMPGTITAVKVNPGDSVKRGETLMILEAMKMENEIKAPFDGIVATIEVAKGAAVNAGMALLIMA